MTNNQALLKNNFPDINWSFAQPLAELSYFKLGGLAEIYAQVSELKILKEILVFCEDKNIPWTIVGGMSNVVIDDEGITGLVLHMACKNFQVLSDDDQTLTFKAEAGIKTSQLVSQASNLRGTGLEGFIGVPGTLGGAIYNNAHYLDSLIGDYIVNVHAFHVKNKEELIISRENCQFAYEHSIFQNDKQWIILAATFALSKDQAETIKEKLIEAQFRRKTTQPLNLPSSGCIFQNPKNTDYLKKLFPHLANREFIPAGFLIDQAGLKNLQAGAIMVSEQHAAFLVNASKQLQLPAYSRDVKKLIKKIQSAVKAQFRVELKEEIFYLANK